MYLAQFLPHRGASMWPVHTSQRPGPTVGKAGVCGGRKTESSGGEKWSDWEGTRDPDRRLKSQRQRQRLGMVMEACNPSTQEAEPGGSGGQSGQCNKTPSGGWAEEMMPQGKTQHDDAETVTLVPDSLTHRCHPSLSSVPRHCSSLGVEAGEAGAGRRVQGLGVLGVLPGRSQPGLLCGPLCLGSGAAHRTGGGERGAPGSQHPKTQLSS
jgi:hypothetical protein